LVCHIGGSTYPDGIREQGAEGDTGPKRDESRGEWSKLHNEKLYDMYSSPIIIRVIKSRMKRAGQIARARGEVHAGLWSGSLKEKDHAEDVV
jgi:hypothetical protein